MNSSPHALQRTLVVVSSGWVPFTVLLLSRYKPGARRSHEKSAGGVKPGADIYHNATGPVRIPDSAGAQAYSRAPTRCQVSTSPLPLTSTSPRGSARKSSRTSSQVARVIWIAPGVPCASIRLAMFTVSPQRS